MHRLPQMPDVPIVTRVYEERFMRESMSSSEKDCMMGEACECMLIDAARPFVATQFVIPNISNEHQGMCVLCLRKTTQLLYYKTIYNGVNVNTLIQKYGLDCFCYFVLVRTLHANLTRVLRRQYMQPARRVPPVGDADLPGERAGAHDAGYVSCVWLALLVRCRR